MLWEWVGEGECVREGGGGGCCICIYYTRVFISRLTFTRRVLTFIHENSSVKSRNTTSFDFMHKFIPGSAVQVRPNNELGRI